MNPGDLARGLVDACGAMHRFNMDFTVRFAPMFGYSSVILSIVGMVGTCAVGGWNDSVVAPYEKLGAARGIIAVNAVLPLERGVALEDGSWLVQVSGGHVFGWCERRPEHALDVRGRVIGYVGAHALPEAIHAALDGAPAGAVVVAIDGCQSGLRTRWDPAQRVQARSRPVRPTHTLHVRGAQLDLTHPMPVADGRTLYPLVPKGAGATERATAWILCGHDPTVERGEPWTGGRVVGWYGAGHLPGQVSFALDRSNEVGWVESTPETVVIEASCRKRDKTR